MPYKSAKQRSFMHIHHPGIARRWDKETGGKVAGRTPFKKAGTQTFSAPAMARALQRRSGGTPASGMTNMPSGRSIPTPRGARPGVRSIPESSNAGNIKNIGRPSKAQLGGNQLQGVARRAIRRRGRSIPGKNLPYRP